MNLLDRIQANRMPMAEHLGVEFLEAERDQVTAWMQTGPEHRTVGNAVHGGVIMAFADSLGGATAFLNLPAGAKGTTTLESKTNFIAAAPAGSSLVGVANILHRGRRTQVVQTRVETGQGRVVAFVTQTQMTLFPERGRDCDEDYLTRNRLEDAEA
jgi:1,4-dihydroxy-2-naphthoyl-CoA hydrolase